MAAGTQLQREAAVIASGVDALYLSGHYGRLGPDLVDELEHQRTLAEARLPASLELGALRFEVSRRAWHKYRFCLDHPIGRVGLSPSAHLPSVRVQPRSEFLHAVGPERTVAVFDELLRPLVGELRFAVSRIDLYADLTGFPLRTEDHAHSSVGPMPDASTRATDAAAASTSVCAVAACTPASTTSCSTSCAPATTGGSRSGATTGTPRAA